MVKVLVSLEFAEVEVKRGKLWRIDQSLKTQTAVQQSEETSHMLQHRLLQRGARA